MTERISTSRRQFLGLAATAGAAKVLGQTSSQTTTTPVAKPADRDLALTGKGMKALLFFDDWLLHRRDGLERRWHKPTFVKELFSDFYSGFLGYGGYMTVFHEPRVGRYVMYLAIYPPEADSGVFVVRLESDDPRNWPNPRFTPGVKPAWKGFQNVVTDQHGERFWPFAIQSLAGTPLAERGYVAAHWYQGPESKKRMREAQRNGQGVIGAPWPPPSGEGSVLAFSEDGLCFNVDREHPWRQPGADTPGNFLWSEKLGKFVIYTRRLDNDRRINYSTTDDFLQFTPLVTAIQPDAIDPIETELYEMPVRPYEDLYLGMLKVQLTEPLEKARVKTSGRMETQLAHSYNGIHWVRPVREPFMGVRDYGLQGGGQVYGMEMLRTSEDRLLFYAHASYGEHAAYSAMKAAGLDVTGYFNPLLYELRLDGFCSLRTSSRDGLLETKTLIPQAGDLRLNVRTTRHSSVRVQLLDGVTLNPLPGYTFDDAVSISGDHLFAPVRWKKHDDIAEWVGKPVRLEIQMREAELFAVRLTYKSFYTQVCTPPLASMA